MGWFTRENAPTRFGGDLWNDAKVCRIVFGCLPEADRFRIVSRGSGLWCDVELGDGGVWRVSEYLNGSVRKVV